jgi:hypothetical protein
VLTPQEKAYCRGLEALRRRDFIAADKEFAACGEQNTGRDRFSILIEATRLLAYIRMEKERLAKMENTLQETIHHGQETIVCRQGIEEEPR